MDDCLTAGRGEKAALNGHSDSSMDPIITILLIGPDDEKIRVQIPSMDDCNK